MPKSKIAFYETNRVLQKYLSAKLPSNYNLVFNKEPLEQSNVVKDAEILVVFIESQVNNKILDKMPKLKLITTMSTGYDHIDLKAVKSKGIAVCNVPYYGENTVAEHTFALILSISRRIIEANKRVRLGVFDPKGLMGFDLKGKTLGVLGTGSIGKKVIQMADGFDMNILAFDLNKDKGLEREFNLKYVDIDELFSKSDIITLHVPYNKHTHHLIDENSIKKMKKGVVIINTARGGLIDTHALYDGIVSGKVKGAGLDVLEEENFLKEEVELIYNHKSQLHDLETVITDHVLIHHPNVIVTPHSAFNSKEAVKRIWDTTVENISQFLSGKINNPV